MRAKRSYEQEVTLGQTSAHKMKILGLSGKLPARKRDPGRGRSIPRIEQPLRKSTPTGRVRGTPAGLGMAGNG